MKVKIFSPLFLSAALSMVLCAGAPQAWAALATTTTTLAITSDGGAVTEVEPGSVVTLTATVKAGSTAVKTGQVSFCNATAAHCTDIHLLGTGQLTKAGTAELKFVPGIGSHSYKAVFLGTTSDAASSSSASALTVPGKYPTTTTIAQGGVAGNWTLKATVVGTEGLASPTGAVSFLDTSNGNAVLGTAALGKGVAALNWTSSQTLVPAAWPANVAIGDFNGDGKADLALTGYDDNTLVILLGNGDGTFTAAASAPTGPYLYDSFFSHTIAVGDFNGDGIQDLAVLTQYWTVMILLGNGDGTFTALAATPASGSWPTSIAVGDFNGDGIPDLAVANGSDNMVTILLGKGDGTFTAAPVSPATGTWPSSIVVADFNGDGKADLAVANQNNGNAGTVTILLGKGDGTFTAAASPATGNGPGSVAVGDFNGDGKADLAVANSYGNTVTILLGKGDGTFTAAASPTTDHYPESVAVGDFNGDGIPDLAVANNDGTTTVLLGKGDGTFAASPAPSVNFVSIVAGDFNGDGKADLAGPSADNENNRNSFATVLLSQWTHTVTETVSGISPVGLGAHEVEASYPGDSSYGSSVSDKTVLFVQTQTHPPTPKSTTTTLAVTFADTRVTSVVPGSVVRLTATVKSGAGPLFTGQVNFCDATAAHCTDIHLLGAAPLTSAGTAALEFRPGIGIHSYKAVFEGTNDEAASSSSAEVLAVTGRYASATTMIAQGGNAGVYTMTARVTGSPGKGGVAAPIGTVSFLDASNGNAVLGTAALVPGAAGKNWVNSQTPAAGDSPFAIAVGDFNGDGIPDLVVTDTNDNIVTILLGNGDGTFTPAPSANAGGNYTNFVAVGDLNGDGIPDLVIVPSGNDDGTPSILTILLGNGDGTFTTAASPKVGADAQCVAIGDFNGDGIPDLAVANYSNNNLTILLGNGDGTFRAAAASPATGSAPYFVAVGNFNGDGKADLVVANSGGNTLTILLGNGDGTFKAAASPATGKGPAAIAVGDFNGDGKEDLAVANYNGNTVTILLGKGNGTFTAAASPATGSGPASLAVGNFNGDGIPDLAVTNLNSNTVTILLGKGDGTFTTSATLATGNAPDALAVADFNGDGLSDLAAANFGNPYGNGNSTVTVWTQWVQTSTATASGLSVVGTGTYLVEASYGGDSIYGSSVSGRTALFDEPPPTITTLAVTSGGTRVTSVPAGSVVTLTATVKSGGAAVRTGQVNFCDATAAHCTDIHLLGTEQLTSAGTATLKLVPGIGSHSYKAVFEGTTHMDAPSSSSAWALTVTATTGKLPTTTAITASGTVGNYTLTAKVEGTGGTTPPTGTVSFLDTSNGNAVLATAALGAGTPGLSFLKSASPATGIGPYSVAVADFNRDGKADLAVTNFSPEDDYAGSVTILLGNGDGTFTATSASPANGIGASSIAVADFNGDGIPDLALADAFSGNKVTILLGNGDGTFKAAASPATGVTPLSIAVGDFNGDGIADLAVGNVGGIYNSPSFTILLGNGDGTFRTVAAPVADGQPESIAVGDFNRDGIPDLAVAYSNRGNVSILLGNGDGTFRTGASTATGGIPYSVVVADFNGDGVPDLAVANQGTGSSNPDIPGTVAILLGKGDGTFTAAASPPTGNGPQFIAVGDFNGDGKADVAVTNYYDSTLTILLGKGDGTFTEASTAAGSYPQGVAVGDFNGDGRADVAVADYGTNTMTILLTQLMHPASATATRISPAGPGTHLVEASYPGDSRYNPSVSTTVSLKGTGTGPAVSFSAVSLSFGNQLLSTTSAARTETVTNNGTANLTISKVSIDGTNSGDFAKSADTCTGATVVPTTTCKVSVTFKPAAAGSRSASLNFTDNAYNSPQTVGLTGTGVNPVPAELVGAPDASSSYYGMCCNDNTSLAAEFTLSAKAYVTTIDVMLLGSSIYDFSLQNSLTGSVTTFANAVISAPNASQNTVAITINATLLAGTYYLVGTEDPASTLKVPGWWVSNGTLVTKAGSVTNGLWSSSGGPHGTWSFLSGAVDGYTYNVPTFVVYGSVATSSVK